MISGSSLRKNTEEINTFFFLFKMLGMPKMLLLYLHIYLPETLVEYRILSWMEIISVLKTLHRGILAATVAVDKFKAILFLCM